jgi:hypothetical protein
MKRSSGPRKTATLPKSIHQQLNMYALVASAAGVSLLALAQPAEAEIVYTPANRPFPHNKTVFLDLNKDGTNDFKFMLHSSHHTGGFFYSLRVEGSGPSNEIWFAGTSAGRLECAAALPKGIAVGPGHPFRQGYLQMFFAASGDNNPDGLHCPWVAAKTQPYLPVRFSIAGAVHYGWVRFTAGIQRATLTGYAYETIPNKPIITGRTKGPDDSSMEKPNASVAAPSCGPSTLGLLAMGAPGLSIWRREESGVVPQS